MVKFVVTLGFLVAFAAGLVVGIEKSVRPPVVTNPSTRPSGPRGGGMTAELKLTPEQQEQMKKIWQDVAMRGRNQPQQGERRQQLRVERDEAIAALVKPEDKEKYDQIQKNYHDQLEAMDRELHEAFDKAVKLTDEILTPEQRTKYHEILSRHQPGSGGPGHRERGPRGSNPRGNEGATSMPRQGN